MPRTKQFVNNCNFCGKEFSSIRQYAKFCSIICRNKYLANKIGDRRRGHTLEYVYGKEKAKKWISNYKEAIKYIKKRSYDRTGEKNPNWRGGISKSKYINMGHGYFNKDIKMKTLSLYEHKCRLCNKIKGRLCAHHIDYDKSNNRITNLVLLCSKCHGKTNSNRNYWAELFHCIEKYERVKFLKEECVLSGRQDLVAELHDRWGI